MNAKIRLFSVSAKFSSIFRNRYGGFAYVTRVAFRGTPNGGKVYPKLLKRLFNSHFLSISVYTIFKEEKIRRKRLENGERRD